MAQQQHIMIGLAEQQATTIQQKKNRHTYYGTTQDSQAIEEICTRYGLASASEAIRFALRLVALGDVQIHVDGSQLPRGYQAR